LEWRTVLKVYDEVQDYLASGRYPETATKVSLVPRRSHLQYLIAYSMQIRRGKAWEISSLAVTSGRLKVDTRGAVQVIRFFSPLPATLPYRKESGPRDFVCRLCVYVYVCVFGVMLMTYLYIIL